MAEHIVSRNFFPKGNIKYCVLATFLLMNIGITLTWSWKIKNSVITGIFFMHGQPLSGHEFGLVKKSFSIITFGR